MSELKQKIGLQTWINFQTMLELSKVGHGSILPMWLMCHAPQDEHSGK